MVSLSSSMTSVLNILNPTHTSEQGRSQFYCTVDDNQLWYLQVQIRSELASMSEVSVDSPQWDSQHLDTSSGILLLPLPSTMGLGVTSNTQPSHLAGSYQIKQENMNDIRHLQDFAVILFIIGCYQICMIMSALFHTFSSHSQNAHELCLMMDLSGIMASITASFLCGKLYKGQ